MSSEKWTQRDIKTTVDGADRVLVLDSTETSPTPLNNKTMSITTLNTFQSFQNVVNVTNVDQFPDKLTASFDDIGDDGSGNAQFIFSVAHGYLDGQTIEVVTTSPVVPAYDGFHVIKFIDTFNFVVIGLSSAPGTAAGNTTRCLAKDTAYRLGISINTALGYKAVDFSNNLIEAISRVNHTITMTGAAATFYTADKILRQEIKVDVNDGSSPAIPFQNTLFNVKGTNNLTISNFLINESTFTNFGSLGILEGLLIALNSMAFNVYFGGFTATNVQFLSVVSIAASAGTGSTFLTIKNLQTLKLTIGSGQILDTPSAVNFGDFVPAVFPGDSFIDIDPATPLSNNFVFTSGSPTLGGTIFKQSSTAKTGVIHTFAAAPSPRNLTHTLVSSTALGLLDGMSVNIVGSINYNGTHLISTVVPNVSFEILVPFVIDDVSATIRPSFKQVRVITAIVDDSLLPEPIDNVMDNNAGGSTIIHSAIGAEEFIDGRQITITGTVTGSGAGATGTAVIEGGKVIAITVGGGGGGGYAVAPIVSIADPVSGTTATAISVINNSIVVAFIMTDNGSGYAAPPTVDVTPSGRYDGTFKIFNVLPISFDILHPFLGTSTGTASLQISTITCAQNGFANDASVLIDKTIDQDGGGVVSVTLTPDVNFKIDIPTGTSTTGIATDDSLDGTALNALVNTVSGELNSQAKGSLTMLDPSPPTNSTINATFTPLVLNTALVKETDDTELFRVTNKAIGEIQYRGLEPFSGQLTANLSVKKSSPIATATGRVTKNNNEMIDAAEFVFTMGTTIDVSPFVVSINAVTGDKFTIQLKLDTAAANVEYHGLTIVIQ